MTNRFTLLSASTIIMLLFTGLSLQNSQEKQNELDLPVIMRLLMHDVHTINEGIYTENFDLIEAGASAINSHASISDESQKLLQETLEDRMSAFAEFDNRVHVYADSIKEAAAEQRMDRVLQHYRVMEMGCINCHSAFRDEVMPERQKIR